MQKTNNKYCSNFLLSDKPKSISFFQYQIIYKYIGKDKYFKSFNILKDERIVKKFYLEEMLFIDKNLDIIDVIEKVLIQEFSGGTFNNKNKSKKKKSNADAKSNSEARSKAALKILENIGYK